jgi:hypothetical protein
VTVTFEVPPDDIRHGEVVVDDEIRRGGSCVCGAA